MVVAWSPAGPHPKRLGICARCSGLHETVGFDLPFLIERRRHSGFPVLRKIRNRGYLFHGGCQCGSSSGVP